MIWFTSSNWFVTVSQNLTWPEMKQCIIKCVESVIKSLSESGMSNCEWNLFRAVSCFDQNSAPLPSYCQSKLVEWLLLYRYFVPHLLCRLPPACNSRNGTVSQFMVIDHIGLVFQQDNSGCIFLLQYMTEMQLRVANVAIVKSWWINIHLCVRCLSFVCCCFLFACKELSMSIEVTNSQKDSHLVSVHFFMWVLYGPWRPGSGIHSVCEWHKVRLAVILTTFHPISFACCVC